MQRNLSINREQKVDTVIDVTSIENSTQRSKKSFSLIRFIFSIFNIISNVLLSTLFYNTLTKLLVRIWKHQINNTFGVTTFQSYGAFWISFAGCIYLIVPKSESVQQTKKENGFFLYSWFILTLYMNFISWRISKTIFSIFTVLNLTFLFLIIGNLSDVSILTNIGGLCGILTAILAWYASIAVTINITLNKSILPVGTYQTKERKTSMISIDF